MNVAPFAKAVVAGAVAGLSYAASAAADGFTTGEVLGIAVATLAAFEAVYWVPNKDHVDDRAE